MQKLISKDERFFIAGSNGMVGKAICKLLTKNGFSQKDKTLLDYLRIFFY